MFPLELFLIFCLWMRILNVSYCPIRGRLGEIPRAGSGFCMNVSVFNEISKKKKKDNFKVNDPDLNTSLLTVQRAVEINFI